MEKSGRIVSTPEILDGKPRIKGTRISVDMILEWFATEASIPTLLKRYPHLSKEGIKQALKYAAYLTQQEKIFEVKPA